jgi:Mg2+/Co2+ transporter CorC
MKNLKKQLQEKIAGETQERDRLLDMLKNSEDNNLDEDVLRMEIAECRAKAEAYQEAIELIN